MATEAVAAEVEAAKAAAVGKVPAQMPGVVAKAVAAEVEAAKALAVGVVKALAQARAMLETVAQQVEATGAAKAQAEPMPGAVRAVGRAAVKAGRTRTAAV